MQNARDRHARRIWPVVNHVSVHGETLDGRCDLVAQTSEKRMGSEEFEASHEIIDDAIGRTIGNISGVPCG